MNTDSAQTDARTAATMRGARAVALVATLLLGVIAYQLNASMVTPALPEMARELRTTVGDIAQVSSLFFLAGAIAGVVLSRFSDFLGRKRMLLLVLAVTVVGTLVCVLAPNLPVLLAGRVLQGSSSAAFQLAYVILNERLRAKVFGTALGVITAINGGVGGVDGYAGGLLSDRFGYRAIFVVVLLVVVVAIASCAAIVPADTVPSTTGRMDWWGSAALSLALICVTYGVSAGSSDGWTHPATLGWLAATAALFVVFVGVERRSATPLIAVEHLRSRQVWPVIATTVLTLAGVFAVINFTIVVLSQNPETGYGLTAARSALLFLAPPALIGVFAAPLSGWLATRAGWIRLLRIGLVVCIAALAVIAAFPLERWLVFAMIAALGVFYNGVVLTTVNGLGVLQSPEEAPAALPGLNGAAFGIGAGLGIGIVAPFVARGGYDTALWISVGVTVLALAASLCLAPRERN